MDLLANVLRARNEANFAVKWQRAVDTTSKRVKATVDDLVKKNGFAGSMLNENGMLSSTYQGSFAIL